MTGRRGPGRTPARRSARGLGLGALLATLLAVPALAQPVIRSQPPCPTHEQGFCLGFTDDPVIAELLGYAVPPVVLRTFTFDAPGPGAGQVGFHGTLYCAVFSDDPRTVDVETQIVTDAEAAPDVGGPGGLRHSKVLVPSAIGNSDSFNLRSTRVVDFPGPGPTTFLVRLASSRLDPGIQCVVYNAAFSILYVPRPAPGRERP